MISVLDFGAGNVGSVIRMIEKVGGSARRVSRPGDIDANEKVIIPGVGAFDNGMSSLSEGWLEPLNSLVDEGRVPILGICLGMQLLCRSSQEGVLPGLGWIDAEVVRFEFPAGSPLKIPHMGWNTIEVKKTNPLFPLVESEQRFYFVHSYHVVCRNPASVIATTVHGAPFVAAVRAGNVFGVQFHPEKSHRFGMALLRNFQDMPLC